MFLFFPLIVVDPPQDAFKPKAVWKLGGVLCVRGFHSHQASQERTQRQTSLCLASFISMYLQKLYIHIISLLISKSESLVFWKYFVLPLSFQNNFASSKVLFETLQFTKNPPLKSRTQSVWNTWHTNKIQQVKATTTIPWLNGETLNFNPWILPAYSWKKWWNINQGFIWCGWSFYVSVPCTKKRPDAYLPFASSKFKETNRNFVKCKKQRTKRGKTEK